MAEESRQRKRQDIIKIIIVHDLPVPQQLLDKLIEQPEQLFQYLEQLMYLEETRLTPCPQVIFSHQHGSSRRAVLLQLTSLLFELITQKVNVVQSQDTHLSAEYTLRLQKLELYHDFIQFTGRYILGLDQRADLWGEALSISEADQQKFAKKNAELQQICLLLSQMNWQQFERQRHSFDFATVSHQANLVLDELTYNNHAKNLQWVATELLVYLDLAAEEDKELLANFILRSSHAILLIDQYWAAIGSGVEAVEPVLIAEIDFSCYHINEIWSKPKFQRILRQQQITRERAVLGHKS